MNRSIDLLEELARESGNVFNLNRRGYLFATSDPARLPELRRAAEEAAALGSGAARVHATASNDYEPAAADGFASPLTGSDVTTEPSLIRRHFPFLSPDTLGVLHARRCGWFSGQQLGMYLLERAREHGVRFVAGRVDGIDTAGGRVRAVRVTGSGGGETIGTERAVLAAGPYLQRAGRLLGVDIPVFCELHARIGVERRARQVSAGRAAHHLDRSRHDSLDPGGARQARGLARARPTARRTVPGRPRPARGRGREHRHPRDLDLRHGARGARPSPRASTPRIPRSSCTGWRG